jgi:hypothetical protein
MKNIHLVSTDKPSRFLYNSTLKSFCIKKEINGMFINDGKVSGADFWGLEKASNNGFEPHNIYITSDEEIKEGDWYLVVGGIGLATNNLYKSHGDTPKNDWLKKIILTTDQDLIKDGVQAIDGEFLEWFVKNPSCEYVTVCDVVFGEDRTWKKYIIIPKEEQKQHLIDIMRGDEELGLYEEPKQIKCYCGHTITCDCGPLEEPKQETLEEAAENFVNSTRLRNYKVLFIEGAKWQQEQILQFLYSEITERRPYSSSKMCEVVIEFIEQLNTKK